MFFIVIMLLLNFGISWWNAYVAGVNWVEAKIAGGFARLLIWSAAIQSACGFTMCLVAVSGGLAHMTGYLPPQAIEIMFKLTYLLIVIPIIGTGLIITGHSWMAFYRERSVMNAGVAAWNTYAQVSNIIDAIRVVPSFMGDIGSAFSSDSSSDDDNPLVKGGLIVATLIVICCALGGILLTATLIKSYAGTRPVPVPAPQDVPTGRLGMAHNAWERDRRAGRRW